MLQLYPQWRTAWITGASTGIGRELALKLAASGVRVAASARSADKLAELARENTLIEPFPVDVTDVAAVAATEAAIRAKLGPIDLAVFNAGVWEPMGALQFKAETVASTMSVNYQGVANGVAASLPEMIRRKRGHVAMVSSVAGYIGLPMATAYSPSKAALISLAQSLQHELDGVNVKITVICPGYIETPMTSVNKFPMPYIMPAGEAADRILTGLAKGKFEIAFPWQLVWPLKFFRALPHRAFLWWVKTFMTPPAK